MSRTSINPASLLSMPRRTPLLRGQPSLLPAIMLALATLQLSGCASTSSHGSASASKCSPEQKANCICKEPGVVSFAVTGMSCPNCAKELQEVLAAVPGVKSAKVCFEDKKAFVTLDKDHPATMEAINAAVAKREEEHLTLESDPNCIKPKS